LEEQQWPRCEQCVVEDDRRRHWDEQRCSVVSVRAGKGGGLRLTATACGGRRWAAFGLQWSAGDDGLRWSAGDNGLRWSAVGGLRQAAPRPAMVVAACGGRRSACGGRRSAACGGRRAATAYGGQQAASCVGRWPAAIVGLWRSAVGSLRRAGDGRGDMRLMEELFGEWSPFFPKTVCLDCCPSTAVLALIAVLI
jgi:hypothetical protein